MYLSDEPHKAWISDSFYINMEQYSSLAESEVSYC